MAYQNIYPLTIEKIYNSDTINEYEIQKIIEVSNASSAILTFYDISRNRYVLEKQINKKNESYEIFNKSRIFTEPLFNFNSFKIVNDFSFIKQKLDGLIKSHYKINKIIYLPIIVQQKISKKKIGEFILLYDHKEVKDCDNEILELYLDRFLLRIRILYTKDKLHRKNSQLISLIDFAKSIRNIKNKKQLLKAIMEDGLKGFKETFHYIPECILREKKGNNLVEVYLTENIKFVPKNYKISEPIFNQIIISKQSKIINDPQNDPTINKIIIDHKDNKDYCFLLKKLKSVMLIPFITNNNLRGIYVVYSRERYFGKSEMRFFNDMAVITSIAFDKLESYENVSFELKEKVERLDLLKTLIKDILAEKDDDKLLEKILNAGLRLVNSKSGNIRLIDREKNVLKKIYSSKSPFDGDIKEMNLGEGVCGEVALTGKAIKEDDAYQNERWKEVLIKNKGKTEFDRLIKKKELMRSEISAPLKDGDNIIGSIDAHKMKANGFTQKDLEIFKDLAVLSGIVLKRNNLRRRLDTIKYITRYYPIVKSEDFNHILEEILEKTLEVIKVKKGSIAVEETDKGRSILKYKVVKNIYGIKVGQYRELEKDIMEVIAKEKYPENSSYASKYFEHIKIDSSIKSEMVVPMIFDSRLKGILTVASSMEARFDDDDLKILNTIGNQTVILIHNIELLKEKEENYIKMENELIQNMMNLSKMMAHQINTPLAGIEVHASIIKDKLEIGRYDISKNLVSIFNSIKNASIIINKIKDFTMRAGLELKGLNLHDVLGEAVEFIKGVRINRGIKIIEDYDTENISDLNFDRFKILQVFLNIIDNAFKAMKEKGNCLKIKTFRDGNVVKIIFEDNGKGIPEKNKDKIFRSFFTTDKVYGTGLGLPISKRFIELHNGRIEFKSKEGEGTKFIISLPFSLKGGTKCLRYIKG